jgi:hypothetical protein
MTIEPTDYILRLARSFPCLRSKIMDYRPAKFDPDAFHALMDAWSHGERLCGLFVLNVWNPVAAKSKGWQFDLMDFVGIVDAGNSLALEAWIRNPIFP